MRSKAPLLLMEQVVMTLVFALTAALCLQVFVFSEQMSLHNEKREQAVQEVQNVAEMLKSFGGSVEDAQGMVMEVMGGILSNETLYINYDSTWQTVESEGAYRLECRPVSSSVEGLVLAKVGMYAMENTASSKEELFSLTIAWQEEVKNE